MTRRVIKSIARLASKSLQARYCIDGDSRHYILPEELLEAALHDSKHLISFEKSSDKQRRVLIDFVETIESCGAFEAVQDQSIDSRELILSNMAWNQARNAASRCLAHLGVQPPDDSELF